MALGIKTEIESKGITLAEYVANLQTDKQEYDSVNDATDDYLDEAETPEPLNVENEPADDGVDIIDTLGTNELADVFVNVFNVSFNVFARAFSQGYVDTEQFEARPDELASIKKPLRSYLKTKNVQMSPGMALLIVVLAVYAPKTFMLVSAKKQAIKELKEKNESDSNV